MKRSRKSSKRRTRQVISSSCALFWYFVMFIGVFCGWTNISAPLKKLLKADSLKNIGELTSDQKTQLSRLIEAVKTPPIRTFPKNGLPLGVDTDASAYQVGAEQLRKDEEGNSRPIGYWSRTLNLNENYSVSEKECLAVVWVLTTLRPYIIFEDFIVHIGYASLCWIMKITEPSGRLIRWHLRLS